MWPSKSKCETMSFQSPPQQTAFIELYTSEGCSSCPPAEAWLSGLKESPGLWTEFVPVAFHVDYWDHLGWRDPWADAAFTERQNEYAGNWHTDTVYTPEFVLNGKEWRDWAGQKNGPKSSGSKPGVLTVKSSATNHWEVAFAPAARSREALEVHAALLECGLTSDVKAGENSGRRLKHDFAVLKVLSAALVTDGELAHGDFVLPWPPSIAGGSLAIAVWVTHARQLEPLQATGGWLVRDSSR